MTQPAIVIVGAGVVGCLVARQLAARAPDASITVLDRDAIGAGASRRSAGFHLLRGDTPRVRRMSAFSHAYYADLKLRRPDMPIYPVGTTVITEGANGGTAGGGTAGGGAASGGTADGPGGRYLHEAAPVPAGRPRGPALSLPEGSRSWHITGSHYSDVYRLAQLLAAELRPRVRFVEGVAVTGLTAGTPVLGAPSAGVSVAGTPSEREAPVTVHTGTGEVFVADAVVLAPGPWLAAPGWAGRLAPLGLRVKKVVALHIERRPDPADEAVVLDAQDAFLLPVAHRGHWLFSYSCREWDVDPDRLTTGLSVADIDAARDCLRRYSPALASACRGGRVFCDAYSPGREPVVRALDEGGQVVFAGAANGSGYRLAPAIGAAAADLLRLGQLDVPAQQGGGVTSDHQYV